MQQVLHNTAAGHRGAGFAAEIRHSRALHPLLRQHGDARGPPRWRCGGWTKKVERPAVVCYIILKMNREHNDGLKGRQWCRVRGSTIDTTARLTLCERVKSHISSNVSLTKKWKTRLHVPQCLECSREVIFFFLAMVSDSRSGVGEPFQTGPCGCRFVFQSVMPTLQQQM